MTAGHTVSVPGSRGMDVGFLLSFFTQTWTQSYGMEPCTFRMSLPSWKFLGDICTDTSRVYLLSDSKANPADGEEQPPQDLCTTFEIGINKNGRKMGDECLTNFQPLFSNLLQLWYYKG